jgi:hypothetical protein
VRGLLAAVAVRADRRSLPGTDASSNVSVTASGFDAYDGEMVHGVVWDGTTNTVLGRDVQTVTSGAFVFAFPFTVDRNHYVFLYAYADQNGDGACAPSEPVWGVILYNPVQTLHPDELMGDCSHF